MLEALKALRRVELALLAVSGASMIFLLAGDPSARQRNALEQIEALQALARTELEHHVEAAWPSQDEGISRSDLKRHFEAEFFGYDTADVAIRMIPVNVEIRIAPIPWGAPLGEIAQYLETDPPFERLAPERAAILTAVSAAVRSVELDDCLFCELDSIRVERAEANEEFFVTFSVSDEQLGVLKAVRPIAATWHNGRTRTLAALRAAMQSLPDSLEPIELSRSIGGQVLFFPQLAPYWTELRDRTLVEASAWLEDEIEARREILEVLGLALPEDLATVGGPILLVLLMLYLHAHLTHAQRLISGDASRLDEFPWLPANGDFAGVAVGATTLVLLPAGTLAWYSWESLRDGAAISSWSTLAATVVVGSLGAVAVVRAHRMRDVG